MKSLHLKIFSIILLILLFAGGAFAAYQTLLFDFPNGSGNWHVVYHKSMSNEKIVQYVPSGETQQYWNQTFIIHAYKNSNIQSAKNLLRRLTSQMEAINSYEKYQYERLSDDDAIATRCVASNEKMQAQCDIYRALRSFDGYITIQYISRDTEDFLSRYFIWLEAIKKAQPYQAEFRNDRMLSKESLEL